MKLVLDPSVRRIADGRVLIGGSPLVLLRLTDAGARLIDDIAHDRSIVRTTRVGALIDRLLDAGVVHPVPESGPPARDVTVVVPAWCTPAATLQAIVDGCLDAAAVVIVDDASPDEILAVAGAMVVRRAENGGPGAARMTGLEHVHTPFVAFVDADVVVEPGWLTGLLGHFVDPKVALVAPRVASHIEATAERASTRLARYEADRSPLDLGAGAARVRAGTRVSYVPSAAIVCRCDALRSIDGFDPLLRVGEDVDLVWRLDEAGWRVRYEPAVVLHHSPRASVPGWLMQRYAYGASAAPLAARHPGALAPVRVSAWSASSWLALVCGFPVVGGAIAAATTALLARKLRSVPDGPRAALRLAGLGHLYAGRSLATGVTRAWWPAAALLSVVSRRARRTVLLAVVVPALIERRSGDGELDVATYTAMRLLDDVAYGAGLTVGAIRGRSLDALLPDLTSWPRTRSSSTGHRSRGRRQARVDSATRNAPTGSI